MISDFPRLRVYPIVYSLVLVIGLVASSAFLSSTHYEVFNGIISSVTKQAKAQDIEVTTLHELGLLISQLTQEHNLDAELVAAMLQAGLTPEEVNPESAAAFAIEVSNNLTNAQAAASPSAESSSSADTAPQGPADTILRDCSSQNFPYIYLNVAVSDNGIPVGNLTDSNFACFENNVPQMESFVVTPPETDGGVRLADIVFLIDSSGSMAEEINDVRDNVNAFAQALLNSNVDFRLGLVRFGNNTVIDSANPFVFNNGILLDNDDIATFQSWIGTLGAGGGLEPGYLAVRYAIEQFDFRTGAQKIFIMITDEDSDSNSGTDHIANLEKQAVINLLLANDITVHTAVNCGVDFSNSDYCDESSIRGVTGGLQFNVVGPYNTILDTIVSDTAGTYVLRYFSSNPVQDATLRNIRCDINAPGFQESFNCTYIPGAAPRIQLTQETLILNRTAQAEGTSPSIQVQVTDAAEPFVQSVTLFYRSSGSEDPFISVSMSQSSGNLYRATIPTLAPPGVEYYVRATDGQVSSQLPSEDVADNLFHISVLPNQAPTINHAPISMVEVNTAISFEADVIDTTNRVVSVVLQWRRQGQLIYRELAMSAVGGDTYQVELPPSEVDEDIEYYIRAIDDLNVATTVGTVDAPLIIRVLRGSPQLGASTSCTLVNDANNDGLNNSGDIVRCTVTITNSGDGLAMSARYQTVLDEYAALVNGSVQASQGMILEGNGDTDKNVLVNLGNLAVNGSATVRYDILLGADVDQFPGYRIPSYLDCVSHPTISPINRSEPAEIIIGRRPIIQTEKQASLLVDLDRNGIAGPGDTLQYRAVMKNLGNQTAQASNFIDSLDPNTALIAGSVETTAGTVVSGNGANDSVVDIAMGPMPPGAEVTVGFQVYIPTNFSRTINAISNLAACIYPNNPPVCVGRIGLGDRCQSTDIQLRFAPLLENQKSVSLFKDVDQSESVTPGDVLLYQIEIENRGNRPATNLLMLDELNEGITVVPGTVRTNQGIVIGGNSINDTVVGVNIGTLSPGGRVMISFESTIAETAALNTVLQNSCTVQSTELGSITVPDNGIYISNPGDATGEVSAPPNLTLSKSVMLINDSGIDGGSAGDTLLYLLNIVNGDRVPASNVQLRDILPPELQLIEGTLQTTLGSVTAQGSTIQADIAILPAGTTVTIGFQARVKDDVSTQVINNQAQCSYDGGPNQGRITIDSNDPRTPLEGDATLFGLQRGLFLPIVELPFYCSADDLQTVDVMLVLDSSGSMQNGGKLIAATRAASDFLEQMNLSQDQAGIATFSAVAEVVQPLNQDKVALDATLANIATGRGTAIGEGIVAATEELQSSRHDPNHTPVIILFSDGRNSAGQDPIAAAQISKDAGIRIFTIGLGTDADEDTLRQIASDPADYRFAPSTEELPDIYAQIARDIRCTQ
ncbi:MAG: VWA domain-containing protein [Chloroflexota bacterium]